MKAILIAHMKLTLKRILAFLFPLQLILVWWLKQHPQVVETYYSKGTYPIVSKVSRFLLGWLPFSMGDVLYVALGILIVRSLVRNRKQFFTSTRKFFISAFAFASVVYFAFQFLWGLNYHRQPLHTSLGIGNAYSTEELIHFAERLIAKCNALHHNLSANDSMKVDVPYSRKEIYAKTEESYRSLQQMHASFLYQPTSLKSSLLSLPLTYMGYSGYLNPFTNEAQVNYMMPTYKLPTTSAHEVAHQLGYGAENEANFIGYLATIHNPDPIFQYIGYTYGLRYCLGEIHRVDPIEFERLSNLLNKGIKENYREGREFWQKYQNPAEPIFKKSYDAYLKANNQEKGIKSYSYIVALLVNYYKVTPL